MSKGTRRSCLMKKKVKKSRDTVPLNSLVHNCCCIRKLLKVTFYVCVYSITVYIQCINEALLQTCKKDSSTRFSATGLFFSHEFTPCGPKRHTFNCFHLQFQITTYIKKRTRNSDIRGTTDAGSNTKLI